MNDLALLFFALATNTYVAFFLFKSWERKRLASPSSIFAALTAIHFAIPGLFMVVGMGQKFSYPVNIRYAPEAMLFALSSLLSFHLGEYLVNKTRYRKTRVVDTSGIVRWNNYFSAFATIVLIVIGWLARIHIINNDSYFQVTRTDQGALAGPFYTAIMMAEQFPLYALCIVAILFWRPEEVPSQRLRMIFTSTVLVELAYWVPTGRKEQVILAVILPLVIRYLRNGTLPSLRTTISIAVIAPMFFFAVFVYRSAIQLAGAEGKILDTVSAAVDFATSEQVTASGELSEIVVGRLSLLESPSASIGIVREGTWDLMLGSSYAAALLSFVPRYFWEKKPDLHYGTEFGHASGMLSLTDFETSVSVTYVGEAYLNFAWGGVVPMMVLGSILGWLYKTLGKSIHQERWLLVYVVALPTILYFGGTFALSYGGLLKLLPLFYFIGWIMEAPFLRRRMSTISGTMTRPSRPSGIQ